VGRRTHEDVRLRAEHLREAGRLLWPEPARFVVGPCRAVGAGALVSEFVLVPNAERPRLLVPGRPRAVAAAAVRRYTSPPSRLARARLQALAMLMASGIGPHLLRARAGVYAGSVEDGRLDTIETYLRSVLGQQLHVSLHIGPARANRKPILQLLDPSGRTYAFAKVGVNDLTRRLVRAEAGSLGFLAGADLETVVVPSVVHHGQWRGNEVLVQSALPTWQRSATVRPLLLRAMRELAGLRRTAPQPLVGTSYWRRLRQDVTDLQDSPTRTALLGALTDLEPAASSSRVALGSWHGDWTPWNMAPRGDRLLVWDWERFASGVPVGVDALHYDLQEAVTRGGVAPDVAVQATMGRSAELLRPFGVPDASARLVMSLYLVGIAVRYLQDGQAEAGARLGRLGEWLLPALVRQARTIRGTSS
jgi:hypothetical protein